MIGEPHEAVGIQAGLFWVGRKTGYSAWGFRPKSVPYFNIVFTMEKSEWPASYGVGRVGFQSSPNRLNHAFLLLWPPFASLIGIRKRMTAAKIQNTKQQKPRLNNTPSHIRGACWAPAWAEWDAWVPLPALPLGQCQCSLWGPQFPQLFLPSGPPSLGGVSEWEARAGFMAKSQP